MIHIITDSSSDYDLTLAAQQQVEIIPMRICFGETEYLDRQTISVADFYTKLEQADTLPSTSQITPFQFCQVFQPHIEAGDQIIGIFLPVRCPVRRDPAPVNVQRFEPVSVDLKQHLD